jgi:hypothetical protein
MISPEALFDISIWLVLALILIGVALLIMGIITGEVDAYLSLDMVVLMAGIASIILIWAGAIVLAIIRWLN